MAPAVLRNPAPRRGRRVPRFTLAAVAIGAVLVSSVFLSEDARAGRRLNAIAKAAKVAKVASDRAAQAKSASDPAATNAAAAKPASATPVARPASTAKAAAAAGQKPTARSAQSASGVLKVTAPSAPQEERVTYHYNALGRRDPFAPLVGGGFVGMDVGGAAPPDVGGIKVVGIVWGPSDRFALVEDPRGNSMVLRKGDKVMNGIVESLQRDALVVKLDMDGISQSVTIPVTRKGEQNDGN